MIKFTTESITEIRMAQSCQAKKDVRYYLNGICFDFKDIEDDKSGIVCEVPVIGTDGHIIINIPVDINDTVNIPFGKELILQIEGVIPKTASKGVFELEGSGGTLTLYKSSDGSLMKILSVVVIDGRYPNYQCVMKETNFEEVMDIAFNPTLLANLVKAANIPYDAVQLRFGGADMNEIIKVKINEYPDADIGIMPIRWKDL